MNRRILLLARLTLLASLAAPAAWAQAPADRWAFSATPYLWLPGVSGDLRYGPPATGGAPNVSVDADKILDALDTAFMISLDARKGKWSVFTDYIYLDLTADQSSVKSVDFNVGPGPINIASTALDLGTTVKLRGSVWTLMGGYALVQGPRATLDLVGGLRYFDLETTVSWRLNAAVTGPVGSVPFGTSGSTSRSESLWDAVIGVRGQLKLGEGNWFLPYHFDVGGGDSKLTWQAMAGIAYAFNWGELGLVYRHLSYEQGGTKLIDKLQFSGPAFGVKIRF